MFSESLNGNASFQKKNMYASSNKNSTFPAENGDFFWGSWVGDQMGGEFK